MLVGRSGNGFNATAEDVRTFMTEAEGDRIEVFAPVALLTTDSGTPVEYTSGYETQPGIENIRTYTFTPPAKANRALMTAVFDCAVGPNENYAYPNATIKVARLQSVVQWVATGRNAVSVANGKNTFGTGFSMVVPHNPLGDGSNKGDGTYKLKSSNTRIDVIKFDSVAGNITFTLRSFDIVANACEYLPAGADTRLGLIPYCSA